jgi:hypothetical protein
LAKKQKDVAHVALRLPEKLRRQIANEADKSNRSINQEMVSRLEQSTLIQDGTLRQIEVLASKSGRSLADQTAYLLDSALLAERLGVGGVDGIRAAIMGSSAGEALREVMKEYGLEPITKPSEG